MKKKVYPYIPNSEPEVQKEMLRFIGVDSIDDLISDIPEEVRMKGEMKLPEPFEAEADLFRHVNGILNKNKTAEELRCFLGAGCYNRYVPAVVDEVVGRSEFLTAYAGEPYEDHGRFQALFEYQSMMAELLDYDVCNVPNYDGAQAAGTALRMATRIAKRDEVLIPKNINPDMLKSIKTYLEPDVKVTYVDYGKNSGRICMDSLREKLTDKVAAVLVMNPNFFGVIEEHAQEIADLAHAKGALMVALVEPSTLGVLTPPSRYGADMACGDIQPLGIHMNYGGGVAGFIAMNDDHERIEEYPSRLFGIAPTDGGEWGFGDVLWERTSFANRDGAKEFVGTHSALWGIAAGVYLAAMGPQGMKDLGEAVLQRQVCLRKMLSGIKGLCVDKFSGTPFEEFVVDFSGSGKSVSEINKKLLEKGILGGYDMSKAFPELGQCALFCVTEKTTASDMKALAEALTEILG
ncbi:aminomethyl-transferring glycine dehydrogenase subunit GcvPA [Synergistaceae bacterium OttesenSCG-928-D05]|nr:aminomethyl-transferring glycine dehydrogenase subunit GcvPA [Synergistaceae bacterium OttesenSCG-928-D05]